MSGSVGVGAPRVLLSVLARDGRPFLARCLESLARQSLDRGSVAVRVLDNGSTDGSWELLRELAARLPGLELERSPVNLGFCAGHNRALASPGYDYVGLVNQDCRLEDERTVARLVAASRRLGDRALLQPVVRDGSRRRAWAGLDVSYTGAAWPRPFPGGTTEPFEVPACHAVFLLASRGAVEAVGLLEEDYFAYHEDLEYSMRARLFGVRSWCVPRAEVLHEQEPGRFRGNRFGRRQMERNRWRYLLGYFSWPLLLALLPALLAQEAAMFAWFAACGDWSGKWGAWRENIAGWNSLLALRRRCRSRLAASPLARDFFAIHCGDSGAGRVAEDPAYPAWARVLARLAGAFFRAYGTVFRAWLAAFGPAGRGLRNSFVKI